MTEKFSINEIVKVSKNKKLYDLNKEFTNFEVDFMIKSEHPYEFTIVNQNTLDNEDIKYNKVKGGVVSDKITVNDNIFQNHFLIIKTDSELERDVEVSINCRELKYIEKQPTPVPVQTKDDEIHKKLIENYTNDNTIINFIKKYWLYIGISFAVLALIFAFRGNIKNLITSKNNTVTESTSLSSMQQIPSIPQNIQSVSQQPVNAFPTFDNLSVKSESTTSSPVKNVIYQSKVQTNKLNMAPLKNNGFRSIYQI